MDKDRLPESGLRSMLGAVMLTLHFINVMFGFYVSILIGGGVSYVTGMDFGILIFLMPPLFLILNVINAVSFTRYKRFREIRELIHITRLVTDVTLLMNLVIMIATAILTGILTMGVIGIFSLIGMGLLFGMMLWHGICCNLSASAYVIGEIRAAYREGYMEKVSAWIHTVLQWIPFVSFIDGIIIYTTTGKRMGALEKQGQERGNQEGV